MSLAALILLIVGRITGKIQRIKNKKDALWFLALALMEPFFYFIGETYGVKLTASPTISSMIIATIPVVGLVAGLSFYKEKVTAGNIAGILMTVPGASATVCVLIPPPAYVWAPNPYSKNDSSHSIKVLNQYISSC